jgi:hypothetical protein
MSPPMPPPVAPTAAPFLPPATAPISVPAPALPPMMSASFSHDRFSAWTRSGRGGSGERHSHQVVRLLHGWNGQDDYFASEDEPSSTDWFADPNGPCHEVSSQNRIPNGGTR